jgi:hypothetical protein
MPIPVGGRGGLTSALPLFVLGLRANDAYDAVPLDDAAVDASPLDRRLNLHDRLQKTSAKDPDRRDSAPGPSGKEGVYYTRLLGVTRVTRSFF